MAICARALLSQTTVKVRHSAKFKLWRWLIALIFLCGCSDDSQTLSIATGGPAGLYYPFGGGMASIWSGQLPQVNVKAEVTGGSVINVIQVARGESDLGIAMADVLSDAYLGQGRFPEALPLRVLFSAYPNIVHLLALEDSKIGSVKDLRGKRVSIGAQGSGTAVAATNLLNGLGIGLEGLAVRYLSFGETSSALKDGTIDAGFIVGGLGLAAITELSVSRDMRLIPLTDSDIAALTEQFPSYSSYLIPGGTYSGVDKDVQALGIWSAVVVHEAMSDDLAYQLICSIYNHQSRLLKVSAVAKATVLGNIAKVATVPLHAGAQRYAASPDVNCLSRSAQRPSSVDAVDE